MKTLFLGDLEAQYKICQYELGPQVLKDVDKVIQLGNIISCSADAKDKSKTGRNEITLTFWDKVVVDEKIQLIGKNEIAALNFPDEWTNNISNTFLRDGWLSEEPKYLTATVDKERLITHAGLTHGEWVSIGKPVYADEAAERLNEKYKNTLSQGTCYRLNKKPNAAANPIWADPIMELYPSWILSNEECPFDQVYGGESLNSARGRQAVVNELSIVSCVDNISYRKTGSSAFVKDAEFISIDTSFTTETMSSLPKDRSFYVEKS